MEAKIFGKRIKTDCKPRYTAQVEKQKRGYLQSGWNDEGKQVYKNLVVKFRKRNRDKEEMEALKECWKTMYGTNKKKEKKKNTDNRQSFVNNDDKTTSVLENEDDMGDDEDISAMNFC